MILFFKKQAKKIVDSIIERKKMIPGEGCIVYFPPPSQKKLCEEMERRGILKREMLEGGYMLAEDYRMIYERHFKSPEVCGTVYSKKVFV